MSTAALSPPTSPPGAPSIAVKPAPAYPISSPAVQTFVIDGVSWESYQAISNALPERNIRITYDRGRLEFMARSNIREILSRLFVYIIYILTEELDVPRKTEGSPTFSKKDLEKGIEPDECFYLISAPLLQGRDKIDLDTDPPPDLAVEIDITSSSINRLSIYSAIRIPEVWRYDGQKLEVRQLTEAGDYTIVARSRYFPAIPMSEIETVLSRRNDVDEVRLLREFRQRVRSLAAAKPSA